MERSWDIRGLANTQVAPKHNAFDSSGSLSLCEVTLHFHFFH